jgi:hypothetical protein
MAKVQCLARMPNFASSVNSAMLAYGVGTGFAARLRALVSYCDRAPITGPGCIGTLLYSSEPVVLK